MPVEIDSQTLQFTTAAVMPVEIDSQTQPTTGPPALRPVEINSDTELESVGDSVPYTPRPRSLIPKAELVMIREGLREQARRDQLATLRAKYTRQEA